MEMRSTSMPMRAAASGFWLVARIARPGSVRERKTYRASVMRMARTKAIASGIGTAMPKGRSGVIAYGSLIVR